MDIKSRRPKSLHIAIAIVCIGVFMFIGWRIFQWIFIIDPLLGVYGMLVGYVIVQQFVLSYFFYRDPWQKAKNNPHVIEKLENDPPRVSVVIATKNEKFIIYDAVYSCLNSKYKNLEVVIVNDGSDDDGITETAINELVKANPAHVKSIHLPRNLGKRKAMQVGVKRSATGEIVVFLDSDTIIDEDAIGRLVACMIDDEDLGAVVGYCRALNADYNWLTKMQDTWYHSAFTIGKGMEHSLGTVSCCSGILSAYRMQAILPCIDRWADDHFLGSEFMAGDDRQLTAYVLGGNKYTIDKKLRQWKTGYCESAISISETPATMRKFVKQQIRWEQSWTRVFFFTALWFWRGRHILSTTDYYLRMGLSYLAPIIAIMNLVVAPATGHWDSTIVYVLGLTLLSLLFAMDFRLYNPHTGNKWLYRVGFTFVSVGVLYFLLYYSVYTVLARKNGWLTR